MDLSTRFFSTSPCQSTACIHTFLKKIHVCLVVHEYKHELPFKEDPLHAWCHATDSCLPHLFPVFSALTCKGGADGSVPLLLLLAKVYFAPTLTPSLWMPPPHPQSWSWSAMWEPPFLQHLRKKSNSLLTAAYSKVGGWGIT